MSSDVPSGHPSIEHGLQMGTGEDHSAALARASGDMSSYELSDGDMRILFEALSPIRGKYLFFGIQINVSMDELKKIQRECTDPAECLLRVLSIRLKKIPRLTWNDIDSALRSDSVSEPRVANSIRRYALSCDSGKVASGLQMTAGEGSIALAEVSPEQLSYELDPYYLKSRNFFIFYFIF